jgi:ParB/RepB/Spo0J family partition protein
MNAALQTLPLEQLRPSSTNAQAMRRKSFDKVALGELANSVRAHGLLQPIVVRSRPEEKVGGITVGAHFEIVAGERRWRAAQLAGLEAVPVNLLDLNDEQVIEIQLIENLQREDVHPMIEAEGYHELVHTYGHAIEDVFAKVGKSRSYVYGRMKLLALSKKAREAFYGNEVSASIANLLARIPVEKLQDEALEAVLGFPHQREAWRRREPMSFRQAAEHINEHFMLDLSGAPFPVDDEKLNNAGACGKCPKRTGNQPELFGDVKKGNVCTDTACFAGKTRAWGQRQIDAAIADGRPVISGAAAKKVAPHGIERDNPYVTGGYRTLDDEVYTGRGRVSVKKLMKPGADIALVRDDKSGRVIEVVAESQLNLPKERTSSYNGSADRDHRKAVAAASRETKIRLAIFQAVRPKLKALGKRRIAELVAAGVGYEGWEQVRRLEAATKGAKFDRFTMADYRGAREVVAKLKDSELDQFIAEASLLDELKASSYRRTKPAHLEAAAKAAGVDVAKIRRELAPKKKPKPKKKAGRKK